MTTYLADVAVRQLNDAQWMLDQHAMVRGYCRLCGTPESCGYRDAAHSTFARYGRLPRRQPRATLGR